MKMIKTNSEQLEIKESGVINVVLGVVFALVGVGLALWVVIGGAEMPIWAAAIGLAIAVIGAMVVLSAVKRHVILRRVGESEVLVTKLVTKKQSRVSFQADQIASANLETHTSYTQSTSDDRTGQSGRQRVSTLYLLLKDNTELVLATSRSGTSSVAVGGISVGSFGKAPLSDEAKEVAEFYNVPFNAQSRGGSGIQAIADVMADAKQSTAPSASISIAQPQPADTVIAAAQPSVSPPQATFAVIQPILDPTTPQQTVETYVAAQNVAQDAVQEPVAVTTQPSSQPVRPQQSTALYIPPR